jgi:hypothetical protein
MRDDGVDIDLPSRHEKEGALKYLRNNNVAGADSIPAELLKNGGLNLVDRYSKWSSSWTEGVLCLVYKKGDKLDCKNYRGICLLNVTYKVLAKILYDRLLPHANAAVQHYQTNCDVLRENTKRLFRILWNLLFNVMLEVIVRRPNLQTTGIIYNKETQLLADDLDIVGLGRSQSAVRDAYLSLEREAAKVGLKINEQKTNYMIAARNDRTVRDVGQIVAIGDKHFEVVKEFVYFDDTNEWRESENTTQNPDCK